MKDVSNLVSRLEGGAPFVGTTHDKHCFVVMPFGRDRDERNWFAGWYKMVIEPSVKACGFEPVLAAAEEQPGAINDEIRSHLAFDPMVIVDLGGMSSADSPNPNVMYELGIRHAFGLPVVIMAWESQTLPFDVGNQRAITSSRGMIDIEPTRSKLESFLKAAEAGRFYNPMDAVGRGAALDRAALALTEDSILGVLTEEVRELRRNLRDRGTAVRPAKERPHTVRRALRTKAARSDLWRIAQEALVDQGVWSQFLGLRVSEGFDEQVSNWTLSDWKDFLFTTIDQLELKPSQATPSTPSDEFVDHVERLLPPQPWPSGIHHDIASKLGVPSTKVTKAIQILIATGRFAQQQNGVVVDVGEQP